MIIFDAIKDLITQNFKDNKFILIFIILIFLKLNFFNNFLKL